LRNIHHMCIVISFLVWTRFSLNVSLLAHNVSSPLYIVNNTREQLYLTCSINQSINQSWSWWRAICQFKETNSRTSMWGLLYELRKWKIRTVEESVEGSDEGRWGVFLWKEIMWMCAIFTSYLIWWLSSNFSAVTFVAIFCKSVLCMGSVNSTWK